MSIESQVQVQSARASWLCRKVVGLIYHPVLLVSCFLSDVLSLSFKRIQYSLINSMPYYCLLYFPSVSFTTFCIARNIKDSERRLRLTHVLKLYSTSDNSSTAPEA